MKWSVPVWVLTSVVLAALAAGVEYGLVVVGVYVGANAVSMVMAWSRRPPVLPGVLRGLGWAAALQMPVMLFTVLDRDGRFAATAPSALDPPPPAPGDHHERLVRDDRAGDDRAGDDRAGGHGADSADR